MRGCSCGVGGVHDGWLVGGLMHRRARESACTREGIVARRSGVGGGGGSARVHRRMLHGCAQDSAAACEWIRGAGVGGDGGGVLTRQFLCFTLRLRKGASGRREREA